MNICFQIGLGLLPGTLVAVILLLARKAFQIKKILISILLVIVTGGMLFIGAREQLSKGNPVSSASRKKMIAFANALAAEGACDEAGEVLDEYSRKYGYDNECRLLTARMHLMNGDYESAKGIYRYLCENTDLVAEKADEVKAASSEDGSLARSDLAMLQYVESLGKNIEEYGFTKTSYDELSKTAREDQKNTARIVKKAIDKDYSINGEMQDCAEAVRKVSSAYVNLEDENKGTGRFRRAFEAVASEQPELLTLECVRRARVKAYVLAGDFTAISENLNRSSSYHELMIAAELYMSRLIKSTDFSGQYQEISKSDASVVKDRIEKIYQRTQKKLKKIEKKKLKARISAVFN